MSAPAVLPKDPISCTQEAVLAERRSAAALQVDAQTQLSFFTERALHSSDMFLMG